MRSVAHVLAAVLGLAAAAYAQPAPREAATTRPAASQPNVPVAFARSGAETTLRYPGPMKPAPGTVVLRIFGRATEPLQAEAVTRLEDGELAKGPVGGALSDRQTLEVRVTAPAVRVPAVFTVTPADDAKRVLGELVVYPARDVAWDKEVVLYSCGAPDWFEPWTLATGLPVNTLTGAGLATAKLTPADGKANSLLLLGRSMAGRELAEAVKIARDQGVSLLVLDADWFGDAAGPVSVAPAHLHQGLAEMAKQRWPKPLEFSAHRQPWPGLANRWAWMADETGLPLVEEVKDPSGGFVRAQPTILLNYAPWERQVGRNESADATFLELIKAAASRTLPQTRDVEVSLVAPPAGLDLNVRPVVAAAVSRLAHGAMDPQHPVEYVKLLDLRGTKEPVEYLVSQQRTLQEFVEHSEGRAQLLILGDDKMLDEWGWLKVDRTKKRMGRPGVQWLPADELPASREDQVRLMLKLTELGVPLRPPQPTENAK